MTGLIRTEAASTGGLRHQLLDAIGVIESAAYSVHVAAPDAMEKLQAALRQVVLLYRFGITVRHVEDDIAAATRLFAAVGYGEWSVVRDHEVGLLRSAVTSMRRLV